jgi:hypothetical protein
MNAREISIEIYATLTITCVLLLVGFIAGMFYRPIWGFFMWPELALRSWCSPGTYLKINEILFGRVPVNNTPIGILSGVLFWWPIVLLVLHPFHIGEKIANYKMLIKIILSLVSIIFLFLLGELVGLRGLMFLVMLGAVFYVVLFMGGRGIKKGEHTNDMA